MLLILLTVIRLVVPLIIFRKPLLGILLSCFIDVIDWAFFPFNNYSDYRIYQTWDKSLDLYYLSIAAITVTTWKESKAKILALSFYFYRVIGYALFFITGERSMFLLFPNVFENFFIIYTAYVYFFNKGKFISSAKTTAVLFLILFIPKIIHEYFIHFIEKQPWEVYDIGGFFGLAGGIHDWANYISWGSLFYIVPLLLVLLYKGGKIGKSSFTKRLISKTGPRLH